MPKIVQLKKFELEIRKIGPFFVMLFLCDLTRINVQVAYESCPMSTLVFKHTLHRFAKLVWPNSKNNK